MYSISFCYVIVVLSYDIVIQVRGGIPNLNAFPAVANSLVNLSSEFSQDPTEHRALTAGGLTNLT